MKPQRLTHVDSRGDARMVDVSTKPLSIRTAIATGRVQLRPATLRLIRSNRIAKGNVLATARIAGIQAAKRTGGLIPLCHPLPLDHIDLTFTVKKASIEIESVARITARTGIEMEALTAVAVAALTIYDMCKAVDKTMRVTDIRLLHKTKTPLP